MVPLKKKGNTKIWEDGNGYTGVRLYSTDIVIFNDNVIKLNSGGWRTTTTKNRINQASEEFHLGLSVYQRKGEWFAQSVCGNPQKFFDGISFARSLTSLR